VVTHAAGACLAPPGLSGRGAWRASQAPAVAASEGMEVTDDDDDSQWPAVSAHHSSSSSAAG